MTWQTRYFSDFGFAGGGGSRSDNGYNGGSNQGLTYEYGGYDGSSGGHSSGAGSPMLTLIGAVMMLGIVLIIFFILMRGMKSKKSQKPTEEINIEINPIVALSNTDHNESEKEKWIHQRAAEIFTAYQTDWSNNSLVSIKEYSTDKYLTHVSLMLKALEESGRQNIVSDLKLIKTILPFSVNDSDALPMTVKVIFKFSGLDEVIEKKTGDKLFSDRYYGILEMWNFQYDGETLKLDGISQPTESGPHLVKALAKFAEDNKLYYSPDWGRYILPTQGLIFSDSSLITADVNNHIIGEWGNCLVQIYTYAKDPDVPEEYYLIGQLNIPKSYKGVIVLSSKSGFDTGLIPDNYRQFEMEWGEFNQKYQVYATEEDALPTFELLNPQFMAKLYDNNFAYNLEVVDNAIYVFARITEVSENDFRELLNILGSAAKELKM